MKQSNENITFDLNETLYFEKGQEISEMISISLDPDITIQQYDDYIQVRGIILLQGEYVKEKQNLSSNYLLNKEKITRMIEKVTDTENNRVIFSHRFPVEISVPPYRVNNLDDITVTVDSFDYELPNQNKLIIQSSIHIYGIKSEIDKDNQEKDIKESKEKDEVNTDESQPSLYNQEVKTIEVEETSNFLETNNQEMDEVQEHINEIEVNKAMEDKEDKKDKELKMNEERKEKGEAIEKEEIIEKEKTYEEDNKINEFEEQVEESENIEIQLSENMDETDGIEVRDVTFLTELFNGDEEIYTNMKIYITQDDDTIESIAKRYDISTLQLMRDNQLSGESLQGGQLIRIPMRTQRNLE